MKMTKKQLMEKWADLDEGQDILKNMVPLPYKHEGKTFGLDGIRIDGSEPFVFAVMSRLKDLLNGENHITRLQASFMDCSEAKGDFNKGNGGCCVYIRLAERGREAVAASAFFDKHLNEPTMNFCKSKGIDDLA